MRCRAHERGDNSAYIAYTLRSRLALPQSLHCCLYASAAIGSVIKALTFTLTFRHKSPRPSTLGLSLLCNCLNRPRQASKGFQITIKGLSLACLQQGINIGLRQPNPNTFVYKLSLLDSLFKFS